MSITVAAAGAPGEYDAGVRYRAWQPWSALHPSIAMRAPHPLDLRRVVTA
ncbi:hypothetical protein GCM10022288_05980 [Gryllotalpicola kribbensis]|jgi:uncharacterized protein (DUF2126 family)|uniref:DUF2126 domain-containing protein n=1 Tax=Gryllotalpicola kribbensis TaxID=993084 RepID=A0ABP8AJ38_9MICO